MDEPEVQIIEPSQDVQIIEPSQDVPDELFGHNSPRFGGRRQREREEEQNEEHKEEQINEAGGVAPDLGPPSRRQRNNDPDRRRPMGSFLSRDGSAINSPAHAAALKQLLQLAAAENGYLATLGGRNRTSWVRANLDSFFQAGGPLERFNSFSYERLMRQLRETEQLARTHYDRDHSHDLTGALGEEIPSWMDGWFSYFGEQETNETPAATARRVRGERATIAASVVGRQAALGQRGSRPTELRNATSSNLGGPALRAQNIGNVSVETERVEGAGDEVVLSPPPRRTRNGTRRLNLSAGTSPATSSLSDPASRHRENRESVHAMNQFTTAITGLVNDRARSPRRQMRTVAEITDDWNRVLENRLRAENSSVNSQMFFDVALEALQNEILQVRRAFREEQQEPEGKTEED